MSQSADFPWWKETAIYHVYPRSFSDTNGDGLGDLRGITERLEHIRGLGAGALWMGPVYPSPQVDNGYDISDYRDIDPRFGTLADMEALITEAHDLGLRVVLDLVLNHTSNQHPWFEEALKNPSSPYRDYYIWADPAPDGGPPNNWRSYFSIPAWTYADGPGQREQYYLHLFTPEQPDLNWDNPAVRREMSAIANFWLDKGADGFRLDVINLISKKPGLPSLMEGERSGVFVDGPKTLEYIQEFRRNLRTTKQIVLVGETPGVTPEAARSYTVPENEALDMVLIFDHLEVDHGPSGRWEPRDWTVSDLAGIVARWQDVLSKPSWPSIYLSNHDQPRIVSRYGNDAEFRYESATALATVFYLQRGTPIVYQGEEIGMRNFPLESPDQIQDVETKNAYRDLMDSLGLSRQEALARVRPEARDNSRTPMQWAPEEGAGFSSAEPWYPPNPDYREWNVARQQHQKHSVLGYYRRLLELRRNTPTLMRGGYDPFPPEDTGVFAFLRSPAGQGERPVLVAANLTDETTRWAVPESACFDATTATLLLSNYPDDGWDAEERPSSMRLRPWEAVVLA